MLTKGTKVLFVFPSYSKFLYFTKDKEYTVAYVRGNSVIVRNDKRVKIRIPMDRFLAMFQIIKIKPNQFQTSSKK